MEYTITCPCTGEPLKRTEGPRPEWKMPTPARECIHYVFDTETDEEDHRVTMVPTCHMEDGWMLFWACPECDDPYYDGSEIDWPFKTDEYAKAADLEALGFTEILWTEEKAATG